MMMRPALLASAVALCLAAAGQVHAQSSASAKSTKPQAKVKRIAEQPRRHAAPPATPAEIDLPVAAGEQVAAASLAHFGEYQCEFDQKLLVAMNPKHDAYLDVSFRNRTYTMKPVLSHTGAVRLEDVRGQMLLVQIATKSMMIDTKLGQRIVDACMHEKQRVAAAAPPSGEGIGIDPDRAAAKTPEATTAAAPAASPAAEPATTAAR
ncbi:MAG: hypothetical protein ACLGIT_05305 [Gammaproteobacteria bacterium]